MSSHLFNLYEAFKRNNLDLYDTQTFPSTNMMTENLFKDFCEIFWPPFNSNFFSSQCLSLLYFIGGLLEASEAGLSRQLLDWAAHPCQCRPPQLRANLPSAHTSLLWDALVLAVDRWWKGTFLVLGGENLGKQELSLSERGISGWGQEDWLQVEPCPLFYFHSLSFSVSSANLGLRWGFKWGRRKKPCANCAAYENESSQYSIRPHVASALL